MFGEPNPHPPTSQDWQMEYEACKIWDRPARQNLKDTPFYPWMPKAPPQYHVTFKLGFK